MWATQTFKKEEQNKQDHYFPACFFQFRVLVAGAFPTAQGTGAHSHPHTHSDGALETPYPPHMHTLGRGRNPGGRNPTDMGSRCKLHTHSGPSREMTFLINLITNNIKQNGILQRPAAPIFPNQKESEEDFVFCFSWKKAKSENTFGSYFTAIKEAGRPAVPRGIAFTAHVAF